MFQRLVQNCYVEIYDESKTKWSHEFYRRNPNSRPYIIERYCETFYQKEYFIYYDEIGKIDDLKMVVTIKPEILFPPLKNSTVQSVSSIRMSDRRKQRKLRNTSIKLN
jgi:hypothetical protein